MNTEEKRPESNSCDQNRGGEDWDSEAASATLPNFTLRCTTSTPLSLTDEGVSYTPLGKMIRKPSPKKKAEKPSSSTGSKAAHSSSEANECRKSDVIDKKPQNNVSEAEV